MHRSHYKGSTAYSCHCPEKYFSPFTVGIAAFFNGHCNGCNKKCGKAANDVDDEEEVKDFHIFFGFEFQVPGSGFELFCEGKFRGRKQGWRKIGGNGWELGQKGRFGTNGLKIQAKWEGDNIRKTKICLHFESAR